MSSLLLTDRYFHIYLAMSKHLRIIFVGYVIFQMIKARFELGFF